MRALGSEVEIDPMSEVDKLSLEKLSFFLFSAFITRCSITLDVVLPSHIPHAQLLSRSFIEMRPFC